MEGKMRQEINYLTKLIQQHKDSTKVLSPSKRHWQNPNKYSYIKPKIKSTNIHLNPNFQPLKNKSRCTYKSDSSKCNSVSPGPTIIWENGTNLQNQNQNQKQNHPVILVNPLKIQEVKRKVVLENLGKSSGETSVYMNPRIRETLKAIHVDSKLITSLSSTSRKEQIEVELEGERKQEPKSQELKVHNANKTVLTEMPVEILQEIKKTRQDQSTGLKNSSWKGSSLNLVILSKRKLVRVKRSCSSTSPVASGTPRIQRLPSMAISTGVKRSKNLIEQRHLLTQSTKIKNKYKIDRTKVKKNISRSKIDFPRRRNEKLGLVRIGDVFYNSSKSHLVKSVQVKSKSRKSESELKSLNKHLVEKSRKKLRVPTSKENLQQPQRMNYKSNITNKVKQRSIQILRNKMRKINQPCLIYQKFGFCANQAKGTCPKLHDKKQVSLCRNFLQGKCILDDCPLSHDIVPEKMPTCKYFLDGCCVRDNCPYLHVKVSPNTPVCIPFLRGYCANGNQCKERHVNICPQFEKSGKCSQGKHCPYPHNPRNKASTYAKRKINVNNSQVDKSIEIIEVVTNTADKRRYYEKADTTSAPVGTLPVERDTDRENTLRQIRALKENLTIMENSLNSLSATFTRAQEEQPVESIVVNSAHENLARRKPIGPLPSYIPI